MFFSFYANNGYNKRIEWNTNIPWRPIYDGLPFASSHIAHLARKQQNFNGKSNNNTAFFVLFRFGIFRLDLWLCLHNDAILKFCFLILYCWFWLRFHAAEATTIVCLICIKIVVLMVSAFYFFNVCRAFVWDGFVSFVVVVVFLAPNCFLLYLKNGDSVGISVANENLETLSRSASQIWKE